MTHYVFPQHDVFKAAGDRSGLSFKEYAAIQAMAGMLANPVHVGASTQIIADCAIGYAEALMQRMGHDS